MLIGKRIKVVDAKNKSICGIEGLVVDETKNTLVVRDGEQKKMTIIKEQTITIEETP